MNGKKLLSEMSNAHRNHFMDDEKKLWKAKEVISRPRGRKPRMLTYNNETRPVGQWAAMYGINPWTLKCRINLGWKGEDLFVKPRKVRTPEQKAQDILTIKAFEHRIEQERIDHEYKVKLAIVKVLKMRERRWQIINNNIDHREEIHYAISNVLMMRARRAAR